MSARAGRGELQPRVLAVVTALLLVVSSVALADSLAESASSVGAQLFAVECAHCHGPTGAGDGADAALFAYPPPALDGAAASDPDALVRRILDGGATPLGLDPAALRRRAERGEALVGHIRRMATADWPLVERGRSLYIARCVQCHGPFGRPALLSHAPKPRALGDPAFQAAVTDAELQTMVRHRMPRQSALPPIDDDAAHALTAYVRLLSPGYETYERFCAGCHGEEGSGGRSLSGRPAAPAFDRAFLAAHDTASLRAGVWHMLDDEHPAMPHFRGTLDETAVRAIVAFLRERRPAR